MDRPTVARVERGRHLSIAAVICGVLLSGLPAAPARAAAATDFVRGVYGRDTSQSNVAVIKETGFNVVDVMPSRSELDHLHANGLKGVVSLHMYSNASCAFDKGDNWVAETVTALKDHPAVQAWQITDEPNAYACPTAPAQIRARHELVKRLDPAHDTYVTIALWDGRSLYPYEDFAGTTDLMGLVVYPCGGGRHADAPCNFDYVDDAILAAERDGIARYWAVVQDFEDDLGHRVPTATELTEQFDRWRGSRMEGYFVFHWGWGSVQSRADHLLALRAVNARYGGTSPATPAPTASPSPVPTPSSPPQTDPAAAPQVTPAPAPEATPAPPPLTAPDRPAPDVAPGDELAPGTPIATVPRPVGLEVRLRRGGRVRLSWDMPQGAPAVAGFRVVRDGRVVANVRTTQFVDRPAAAIGHVYTVAAVDSLGNASDPTGIYLAPRRSERRHGIGCGSHPGVLCRLWRLLQAFA